VELGLHDTVSLFRDLDPCVGGQLNQNPVRCWPSPKAFLGGSDEAIKRPRFADDRRNLGSSFAQHLNFLFAKIRGSAV